MKNLKLVLGAAAVLAAGSSWAHALDLNLSSIKVDGSLELKSQSATNETDFVNTANDQRNSTRHKLVLGVGGELTEGVMTRFEAVRTPLGGLGTAGQFGQVAQSAWGEQVNLRIENAYLGLDDIIWGINAKIGRQYVGDAGNLVMYAGHYDDDNMTVGGVDAVNLHHKCGPVDVNYLHATTNDTKTLTGSDYSGGGLRSVVRSLGAMFNLKDVTGSDMLDLPLGIKWHHATNQGAAAPSDNVNLGIYELNAGLNLMENMLMLSLDYGTNMGQRNTATAAGAMVKFKGSLLALKGMLDHKDSGFSAWVQLVTASGDDDNGEPTAGVTSVDDKSWHDLSAFGMAPRKSYGEILGKSNALSAVPLLQGLDSGSPLTVNTHGRGFQVTNLGAGYVLPVMNNMLKVTADYIIAAANKLRGTSATNGVADGTGTSKDLGTELDLTLHYMKSENLGFKLGYASFDPETLSAGLGTGATADAVTKLFAHAMVKF